MAGGGKTAMHFALCEPKRVNKLVVVDISPSHYGIAILFGSYIQSMQKIEVAKVKTLAEADLILKESVKVCYYYYYYYYYFNFNFATQDINVRLGLG